MSRNFTRLQIELDEDGVATVTMAHPPVNAVDLIMYDEIRDLFVDIDQIGPGVRVVVLTGAGKHFSAGNDLDDFATMDSENVRERMFHVREAFFAMQECVVPVVGAVRGRLLWAADSASPQPATSLSPATTHHSAFRSSASAPRRGASPWPHRRQPMVRWMFFTGQRLSARRCTPSAPSCPL